ncbi:hypothetical protein D0T84_18930 [Dysgonomonas sp. 521]|uniref:DUF5362 family protein n=1 Tax=Dysgonomonas sp. 521 TaxID=2302932 RepID=UPI0013D7B8BA|nr:DUF5362 family protein [Dysgonomonas sp. 521]NDV96964.1 hypothetical protein [Dysgonomonas sp. 521]
MQQNEPDLTLSLPAQQFLNSAANWARFIAILGFGIIFIVAIGTYILSLIWSNVSKVPDESRPDTILITTAFTVISIIMTVIYFYALYKMLKFSGTVKRAIRYNDPDTLTKAFEYLNSHYKSMGIMMITGISAYILMSVGMGIFMIYAMGTLVKSF